MAKKEYDFKVCPACGTKFYRKDYPHYARKTYCDKFCSSANMSVRLSNILDSNSDQLKVGDIVAFCIDRAKVERTITGAKGRSIYTTPGDNFNPSTFFTLIRRPELPC